MTSLPDVAMASPHVIPKPFEAATNFNHRKGIGLRRTNIELLDACRNAELLEMTEDSVTFCNKEELQRVIYR